MPRFKRGTWFAGFRSLVFLFLFLFLLGGAFESELLAQQQRTSEQAAASERIAALERRLDSLEEKQDLIIENQQEILEAVKNLRVWIRRN